MSGIVPRADYPRFALITGEERRLVDVRGVMVLGVAGITEAVEIP
jgi:hypothetical protein